jgi:hypothetical protein
VLWAGSTACAMSACLSFGDLTGGVDASVDASDDSPSFSDAPASDADAAAAAGDADARAAPDGCPSVTDPSLLAYYPFDETSGSAVRDCSGNGYDAIATFSKADAGADWTTGHAGNGLALHGTDCVVVTSSALDTVGDFTVTAWINLHSLVAATPYIVGRRNLGVLGWRLAQDIGPNISFQIGEPLDGGPSGNNFTADSPSISAGVWMHVAGVFKLGASQEVFINGAQTSAPMPAPSVSKDTTVTVRIGCKGDGSAYLDGTVDEVRIYSRALSGAEVAALAQH